MTSKEIITRLIDEKLITGEEAYVLINDIIAAELMESIKTLKEADTYKNNIRWVNGNWNDTISISPYSTITCSGGSSAVYDTATSSSK